jgi:SAM-dependent methyltransferase
VSWTGETEFEKIYSSFRIDSDRLQAVTGFEAYERHAFINRGARLSGSGCVTYTIRSIDLGEGTYHISASLCRHMLPKSKEAILHYIEKACTFSVRRASPWHFSFVYEPRIEFDDHSAPGDERWRKSLQLFFSTRGRALPPSPSLAALCYVSGRDPRIWTQEAIYEDMIAGILGTLKLDATSDVLEIGCAAGFVARGLAAHVGRYCGIDIAAEPLHCARALAPANAVFAVAAGERLPFAADRFDAVFCYDVLTNFPAFDHFRALMLEMVRVVKHGGGVLLGSVPDQACEREFVERVKVVGAELDARFGPLRQPAMDVKDDREPGGIKPEIVCYYFRREDFLAFGRQHGLGVRIEDVHPLHPYAGYRFNVIYTKPPA